MDEQRKEETLSQITSTVYDVLGVSRSGERLDLRGWDLRALLEDVGATPTAFECCEFSNVMFGDRYREEPPASLSDARLGGSVFENVAFTNIDLDRTYFRGSIFRGCDFRYARLRATSFADAHFENCDFFRTHFESANVFTNAQFECVSLDKAWLAGIVGLRAETFHNKAMAQECSEEEYEKFLEATGGDRPSFHTVQQALENATLDVADVYRALSGMWTSQGRLADAGFAYVRCKDLERKFYSPQHRGEQNERRIERNARRIEWRGKLGELDDADREFALSEEEQPIGFTWRDTGAWARLTVAWALAQYGESIKRVLLWAAALVVVPALVYRAFGGVESATTTSLDHSWPHAFLFSLQELTDSTHSLQASTSWFELLGSVQFLLGVALLGLLGFTIANRLRNS